MFSSFSVDKACFIVSNSRLNTTGNFTDADDKRLSKSAFCMFHRAD